MFNIEKPNVDELPSLKQLWCATVVAVIGAALILVTIVIPAEDGTDLTRVGRKIGLTEMGNIKHRLHHEAEKEEQAHEDH